MYIVRVILKIQTINMYVGGFMKDPMSVGLR